MQKKKGKGNNKFLRVSDLKAAVSPVGKKNPILFFFLPQRQYRCGLLL